MSNPERWQERFYISDTVSFLNEISRVQHLLKINYTMDLFFTSLTPLKIKSLNTMFGGMML